MPASPAPETIQLSISDSFQSWMSALGGSLAVTTYQAGKVALIGHDGHQVTLLLRQFDKPLGLAVKDSQIALAIRHEVLLFADAPLLAPDYLPQQRGRYDAMYLPRVAYFTGDLNVHDVAFAGDELWIVNTRFGCLAQLSDRFSFVPRWRPPFISQLAPEDRCHLNGLAIINGRPGYVTALGATDAVGGWRENKASGGVIVDVQRNEIISRGLSMPHSPRWHDGRLWVLNSGAGELCQVDPQNGALTTIYALPGYLRGLAFVGGHAVVGMCQIREKHLFGGLPVQQRHAQLKCGLAVIELRSGAAVAMLEFTAGCQELYDVQFLPRAPRPTILNRERDEGRQAFTAPDFAYWLRPENEIRDPR